MYVTYNESKKQILHNPAPTFHNVAKPDHIKDVGSCKVHTISPKQSAATAHSSHGSLEGDNVLGNVDGGLVVEKETLLENGLLLT